MAQKAMFFMEMMRCTQRAGVGSHRGSLATDWGGKDTGKDAIYAPFDCKAARVRTDGRNSHETYLHTVSPVLCADGATRHVTMTLMHDDQVDVTAGRTYRRGEKIGDEGTWFQGKAGGVAAHAHVEFSAGHQTKQTANRYGVYCTPNQLAIEKVCWLPADCAVVYDGGYLWARTTETLRAPGADLQPVKNKRLRVTAGNCEYFSTMDTAKPLGKLARGSTHDVTAVSAAQHGGYRWAKLAAGTYAALLSDRCILEDKPARVTVTADVLNIRSAPATTYSVTGTARKGEAFEVAETDRDWGYIPGKGWLCLAYTKAV